MSSSSFVTLMSVVIDPADLPALFTELEDTADRVWLSRTCVCDRYTIRGVPARRVDVVIENRLSTTNLAEIDPCERIVMSVVEKAGRFDGAIRWRLTVRVVRSMDLVIRGADGCVINPIPGGRLDVELTSNGKYGSVRVTLSDGTGIRWDQSFVRLRSDLGDYSPARLVMWHARRYYGFLLASDEGYQEVVALADSWKIPGEASTLAEANRAASRELYRLARNGGWRKLTLRERTKLGLYGEAQWIPEKIYARAQMEHRMVR